MKFVVLFQLLKLIVNEVCYKSCLYVQRYVMWTSVLKGLDISGPNSTRNPENCCGPKLVQKRRIVKLKSITNLLFDRTQSSINREVWGSNTEAVNSDAVLQTARHCCEISLRKLCRPSAKRRRWAWPIYTFQRNWVSIGKILVWFWTSYTIKI